MQIDVWNCGPAAIEAARNRPGGVEYTVQSSARYTGVTLDSGESRGVDTLQRRRPRPESGGTSDAAAELKAMTCLRASRAAKDAIEFIERNRIGSACLRSIELARRHFRSPSEPALELVTDPESGDCWVTILLRVQGDEQELVRAHGAYTRDFVHACDGRAQRCLRLSLDVV